jgi:hypothetical protein
MCDINLATVSLNIINGEMFIWRLSAVNVRYESRFKVLFKLITSKYQ